MLYVGTALAWVPPFFNVGKFICTAAMFLCFTPTAAIMCILTAAMFGARKYEWLLTSHSIPVQTISACGLPLVNYTALVILGHSLAKY
jgi:hypothetical protein